MNIKKITAALLAAALFSCLGITAFAQDTAVDKSTPLPAHANTTVTASVEPAYQVVIPASVELSRTDTNGIITYEGSGALSADTVQILKGKVVRVTLASDFELQTAEGACLAYKIYNGASALANNGVAGEFANSASIQTITLDYKAGKPEYAGDYTDTVTFTIALADGRTNERSV